jgi:Protein of unknown function (DUF4236)
MGWRFHKRIRIAKGVYWNIGKRGSSLSVGGHGAAVNFSKKGVRSTYSIPGTGISYRTGQSHGSGQSHSSSSSGAGGWGCLVIGGMLLLGFLASPHSTTTTTTESATQVQQSPSLMPASTPVATAVPNPTVRRAEPVTQESPTQIPNPDDSEATEAVNWLQDQLGHPHVPRVFYNAKTDTYNWIGPKRHRPMSMRRSEFDTEVWNPYWKKTHAR